MIRATLPISVTLEILTFSSSATLPISLSLSGSPFRIESANVPISPTITAKQSRSKKPFDFVQKIKSRSVVLKFNIIQKIEADQPTNMIKRVL